jgi:hypothetical protein
MLFRIRIGIAAAASGAAERGSFHAPQAIETIVEFDVLGAAVAAAQTGLASGRDPRGCVDAHGTGLGHGVEGTVPRSVTDAGAAPVGR